MNAAASTAAVHAAMANAVKATGSIIFLEPAEFQRILASQRDAVIVTATGGVFTTKYKYLTSYKGLTFFTVSRDPLPLPGSSEVIAAKKIWVPDML